MNRAQRRASEAEGRRLQALDWNQFRDVTAAAYESAVRLGGNPNYKPDHVYQNHKYIVQCFNNRKILGLKATKVMIRRSDAKAIYSWQDLFRIKNEIWGEEAQAIQMFPKVSELVDDANLYWIWVLESDA